MDHNPLVILSRALAPALLSIPTSRYLGKAVWCEIEALSPARRGAGESLWRSVVEGFQFPAHDLAGGCLGQVGHEPDGAGPFVGGQVRSAVVDDFSLGGRGAGRS